MTQLDEIGLSVCVIQFRPEIPVSVEDSRLCPVSMLCGVYAPHIASVFRELDELP